MNEDCELLLALLNTRPMQGGVEHDELADDHSACSWAKTHGGSGTPTELERLRRLRAQLTEVVLEKAPATVLADALEGVYQCPRLSETGLSWELVTSPDAYLSARVVLAWAWVREHLAGRLRPCGNEECQLFMLDRSKANKARWCSMATCGNRMKARRHYERNRSHTATANDDRGLAH